NHWLWPVIQVCACGLAPRGNPHSVLLAPGRNRPRTQGRRIAGSSRCLFLDDHLVRADFIAVIQTEPTRGNPLATEGAFGPNRGQVSGSHADSWLSEAQSQSPAKGSGWN